MVTSSRIYWKNREEENLRNNLKTEEEYLKTINGYYDYMMDQVQKEINGFYSKYARKEGISLAEAKKRVSELDIKAYERKAAKYVKEKNFSKEANEEMRLYNLTMKVNRLEMLKANIGLELVDGFNDLQKYFEQILTDRTLNEFQRQAGILGKTIRNNAQAANAIVNASFSNAKFSDRIWMYQDMMKAELSKLLQEGLIQGRNPRQLAIHLEKLFGVSKSNAERLMRTELARVQVEAQKQSFERNGYDQYEFIALGSACDVCRAIDGKHFQVKKMMPGSNAPPMHPNCRCSVAAWVDDKEYEQWLDYLDKGGTTEEWNKRKEKDMELTNRRKERMAARETKTNLTNFDSMDKKQLEKWASSNLSTKFDDLKGVNTEYLRETIKALSIFERKMGGTIDGMSVKYGNTGGSMIAAKYDDKTKTLLLKKTGSLKTFEESLQKDNARYRAKWHRDKDYHATTTYKGTVLHELGHAIDIETGQNLSRKLGNNKELYEKSVRVSVYAGSSQNVRVTKASEAFAENFAAYLEGNANAAKVPYEVKEMIDGYFKKKLKKEM